MIVLIGCLLFLTYFMNDKRHYINLWCCVIVTLATFN